MSLESFAGELRSMGFPEEAIEEIVQSLADLYVASRIPYKYVIKAHEGFYTSEDIRKTRYWPYSELAEKVLLQYGYADTSSKYTVYTPHANWYFIALTERGFPAAREAYKRRLEANLDFVKRHIERHRSLAPLLYFGASFDGKIERAYFYSKPTHEVVDFYFRNVIDTKIGRAPEPPIKRRTYHTAPELWEMIKGMYESERLDVVSAAFQSAASTKTAVEALNEFFSPLHERRLVLLMPNYTSSGVYPEMERWLVPPELLELAEPEAERLDPAKLRNFVNGYVSVLMLALGGAGYTKGQLLKLAEVIVSENKELGLSYDELVEGFRELVEEVSSTAGCISRFNEPGGP
ncbi:MAG: hypothetical protein LM590_16720, partial [Thermofilum sp.]|nr:hypothetical protein [Thermofilum sp.]